MNAEEHRAMREMIGAFVLGQLTDAERDGVLAHLDGCASCQAEVAELAPVVLALQDVDPDRLGAMPSPPADLGDRVLAGIRTSRADQRPHWSARVRATAAGLLVAAALVGAFVLGGSVLGTTTAVPPPVVPLSVELAAPGVQADAGLVKHTWGTELKLEATGLKDGAAYTVTFVDDTGESVPAGTFLGTGGNPVRCSLNAALPIDHAARVTVTDAAGALVLAANIG